LVLQTQQLLLLCVELFLSDDAHIQQLLELFQFISSRKGILNNYRRSFCAFTSPDTLFELFLDDLAIGEHAVEGQLVIFIFHFKLNIAKHHILAKHNSMNIFQFYRTRFQVGEESNLFSIFTSIIEALIGNDTNVVSDLLLTSIFVDDCPSETKENFFLFSHRNNH